MKVFVDTSAWIALMVSADDHHAEATRVFERLLAENALVITSNYVLAETLTWLRYEVGFQVAVDFHLVIERARADKRLRLEWVDEAVSSQAWLLFTGFADQELSVADCTSAVIARQLESDVFAYDQDFVTLGFNVLA